MGKAPSVYLTCPECGQPVSGVYDSRGRKSGAFIWRRRECENGHRFTTHEFVVDNSLVREQAENDLLAAVDSLTGKFPTNEILSLIIAIDRLTKQRSTEDGGDDDEHYGHGLL